MLPEEPSRPQAARAHQLRRRGFRRPPMHPATFPVPGRLSSATNVESGTTSYTYDALGHVLTTTVPIDASNNAVTTNTFDAFGNVITTTDALGNTSYYYYDVLDRLVLQIDADGWDRCLRQSQDEALQPYVYLAFLNQQHELVKP